MNYSYSSTEGVFQNIVSLRYEQFKVSPMEDKILQEEYNGYSGNLLVLDVLNFSKANFLCRADSTATNLIVDDWFRVPNNEIKELMQCIG